MILTVSLEDQLFDIDVPEKLIADAEDFYAKLDHDMDQGWQISRYWVENPDLQQRCQIVAEKIGNALFDNNQNMAMLMAGYILSRASDIQSVNIDTSGDITQTEFLL